MKTDKISVNKTAENPEGVEIDIVQPETDIEQRFMVFSLRHLLQAAKREGRLNFDLPEGFQVLHQRDGSFVVAGFRATEDQQAGYYQPPTPIAVVGLRTVGNNFDMIHAPVDPEQLKAQQQQQQQQQQEQQPPRSEPEA